MFDRLCGGRLVRGWLAKGAAFASDGDGVAIGVDIHQAGGFAGISSFGPLDDGISFVCTASPLVAACGRRNGHIDIGRGQWGS